MREWTTARRVAAATVAVLLCGAFAAYYGHKMGDEFKMPDGLEYMAMARGETQTVVRPFASRQLGPLFVRGLVAVFHISVRHGFVIEAILCMLATLIWVFGSMTRTAAPRWLMGACITLPFWRVMMHGIVLVDLWYSAMLCVFLWLLEEDHLLLAAAFLLPLMMSRESTTLTLVCLLLAAWKRLRFVGSALAALATGAGSVIIDRLTANVTNAEHLPESLYLFAKVPWNAVRLTGVLPWSNLYTGLCAVPLWRRPLSLGPLHAIGVCGYRSYAPLDALASGISAFGLLPPLVFLLWRARYWRLGPSPVLRFAAIYGSISFVAAPLLGTGYDRLFGYSWPLFVVALPRLWTDLQKQPDRPETSAAAVPAAAAVVFLVLHIAICFLGIYPWASERVLVSLQVTLFLAGTLLLLHYLPRPAATAKMA
jgi:hypothetical protein